MKIITFRVPERELVRLDMLVARGVFKSRSEAIRVAIKRLLEDVEREGRV